MWGRISNFAEKIDSNFTTEDGNNDGSQAEESSDFGGRADGATPTNGDDESGALVDDDDGDGWGDDDGFDDDFDFGDEQPEPIENGTESVPISAAESDQTLDKEAHGAGDIKAHDGGISDVVEDVAVKTEDAHDANTAMKDAQSESDAMAIEDESAEIAQASEQPPPTLPEPVALAQSPPPQKNDLPNIVTVSAPGKALIAGGYLVLESPNPGVVLAAEGCRFHTTITFQPAYSGEGGGGVIGNSVDAAWESIPLDVYSPQFDRVFSYYLSYSLNENDVEDVSLRLQPRTEGPHEANKFVERSLLLSLGYLHQSLGANEFHTRLQRHDEGDFNNSGERVALAMKLRADNDFYSQITRLREDGLDLTPQNLERLDPFLPCPKDELTGEVIVNKTGMGSSAALVTSIVGALLRFFGVISLPGMDGEGDGLNNETNGDGGREDEGLRIAHNLSQICHCHAQGKVGSGFDVSSAIYGSHIYTRFSKGVINDFLESVASLTKGEEDGLQLSESLSNQLVELVNDAEWDCTVSPISLPPGLELLMADVCGGSESPSMARKILDWKKNKRKVGFMDDYYWKDLKRCNKRIVSLLSDQFTTETFRDGLQRDGAMIISTRTAEQWKKPMPSSWYKFEGSSWDVAMKLLDLRMAFVESRQNLKGMGKAAGVPVEPDEQSALADATMKLPGVVAAGVPGAGGYDALFVIYVKGPATNDGRSDKVRDEIGNLWREMSDENNETVVCPLRVRAAGSGGGLCSTKLDW